MRVPGARSRRSAPGSRDRGHPGRSSLCNGCRRTPAGPLRPARGTLSSRSCRRSRYRCGTSRARSSARISARKVERPSPTTTGGCLIVSEVMRPCGSSGMANVEDAGFIGLLDILLQHDGFAWRETPAGSWRGPRDRSPGARRCRCSRYRAWRRRDSRRPNACMAASAAATPSGRAQNAAGRGDQILRLGPDLVEDRQLGFAAQAAGGDVRIGGGGQAEIAVAQHPASASGSRRGCRTASRARIRRTTADCRASATVLARGDGSFEPHRRAPCMPAAAARPATMMNTTKPAAPAQRQAPR